MPWPSPCSRPGDRTPTRAAPDTDRQSVDRRSAFGPWPTFAGDVRLDSESAPSFGEVVWRVRCRPPGRRPGHAFSGPRSRGTGCGPQAPAHQHRLGVRAGWRPRMGPAPACPDHLPCHQLGLPAGTPHRVHAGRWWRLRAQAPFAVATGPACRAGVDATGAPSAAVVAREVGRRTQAPPPPCRHGGSSHHGGQRMSATGRNTTARVLSAERTRVETTCVSRPGRGR